MYQDNFLKFAKIFIVIISQLSFIIIPILRYYSLNSNIFDFGIDLNFFYNYKNFYDILSRFHFQPIIFIISELLLNFQHNMYPYILIMLQFLTISFFTIFLYFKYGFTIYLLSIFNPIIWGLVTTLFHLDFLFILSFLIFEFYLRKKYFFALLFIIILSLVKEIFILLLLSYYIVYKKNILTIISKYYNIILLSLAIFFLLNFIYIMFINIGNLLLFFSNTKYLESLYSLVKCFLILFLPLITLIYTRPLLIIQITLVILFYFIIGNSQLLSFNNHYLILIYVPYIYLCIYLLDNFNYHNIINIKIKTFKNLLIVYYLFINILISVSPLSRIFWSSSYSNFNFKNYIIDPNTDLIKNRITELISVDANSISSQNNIFYYKLATYKHLYSFPYGVFEFDSNNIFNYDINFKIVPSDYIIINLDKALYLGDISCQSVSCNKDFLNYYNFLINKIEKKYSVIYYNNEFKIYKKNE